MRLLECFKHTLEDCLDAPLLQTGPMDTPTERLTPHFPPSIQTSCSTTTRLANSLPDATSVTLYVPKAA